MLNKFTSALAQPPETSFKSITSDLHQGSLYIQIELLQ